MPRQHHEARFERPLAATFSALVAAVSRGRWAPSPLLGAEEALPRRRLRYERQRGSVLRRGRVVECVRPVSITLHEHLIDPPCCVGLRLRFRLEPIESGSHLRLDASFDLNGAATLRRRHWNGRIDAHCARMLDAVRASLAAADQGSFVSGQKTGSNSITETNVMSASGTPTLR